MADRVNDNLIFRDLVEDDEGIWCRRQTPDGWIVGTDPDVGMGQEQANDVLNASLDALRSLR